MPEYQNIADGTLIKFLIVLFGGGVSGLSAIAMLMIKRIKKNVDDLWSKRNSDHDTITQIKTIMEKNGEKIS